MTEEEFRRLHREAHRAETRAYWRDPVTRLLWLVMLGVLAWTVLR